MSSVTSTYENYEMYFSSAKDNQAAKEKLFNDFIDKFGFSRMEHLPPCRDYGEYVRKACQNFGGHDGYFENTPTAFDHTSVFTSKNPKRKVIVFHSYDIDTNSKMAEECNQWCNKRGLELRVLDKDVSWYYPGHTSLCVVADREFFNSVMFEQREDG